MWTEWDYELGDCDDDDAQGQGDGAAEERQADVRLCKCHGVPMMSDHCRIKRKLWRKRYARRRRAEYKNAEIPLCKCHGTAMLISDSGSFICAVKRRESLAKAYRKYGQSEKGKARTRRILESEAGIKARKASRS